MSPQLHYWFYGYYPSDFNQYMRDGGFRPMVFHKPSIGDGIFYYDSCRGSYRNVADADVRHAIAACCRDCILERNSAPVQVPRGLELRLHIGAFGALRQAARAAPGRDCARNHCTIIPATSNGGSCPETQFLEIASSVNAERESLSQASFR